MRFRTTRFLLCLLAISLFFGASHADWTASGTFLYTDREYDETGFTGVEPSLPVRLADVEIIDANAPRKKAVLATGVTDLSGNYSITVPDSKVRDVYVQVITRSNGTSDLNTDVRKSYTGKVMYYAAATATTFSHSSSTPVDFGSAVILKGQGGEAFNIYDMLVMGMDYLAELNGSRPDAGKHLSGIWAPDNGIGAASYCISCQQILLRDTAGYDDTVILHEMGHYALWEFSASDSPGGTHGFMQCDQDIRLAFDEGFATYWGNSVLRHHQIPRCNEYIRTTGGPGPGNLVRFGDLETDTLYNCEGSTNELNIFSFLWDIADGPSTTDTTPGLDDIEDQLDLSDLEVWEVMVDHIPNTTNISLEDFWDGWFLSPIGNGFRPEMINIADSFTIEYYADLNEINDTAGQATPVLTDGSTTHSSLFSDPELDGAGKVDEDFFSFAASSNQLYVVETKNLRSDGNTNLEILDSDGQTVLISNNDKAADDESSRVDWTAPRSAIFFVRIDHAPDLGTYGSYDLTISAQNPVDNDNDGYDTSTDCNDNDAGIHPGATETCDGVDQNCDGTIDDGFDLDNDGYTTCAGDCDDGNPAVNLGAEEVPGNGIDDNCNGEIDEEATADIVIITRADWKNGPKKLIVEATSDQQPGVTLTVVGFGDMTFDPSKGRYVYTSPNKSTNPGVITVESSGGGSDTEVVSN